MEGENLQPSQKQSNENLLQETIIENSIPDINEP
jgi:hypothetical protein